MKLFYLGSFRRDYNALPQNAQKKFQKQINILQVHGVTYRGLGARKMMHREEVWQARVDIHYRFTFQMQGDKMLLRRIGTHEIYRNP